MYVLFIGKEDNKKHINTKSNNTPVNNDDKNQGDSSFEDLDGLVSYKFDNSYTPEQRAKLIADAKGALASAKGITGRQHCVVEMKISDEGNSYVSVTMCDFPKETNDSVSH